MMDYRNNVQRICGRLGIGGDLESIDGRSPGPLSPGELADAVGGAHGEPVNCYPGVPGGPCCPIAYFFSLKDPRWTRRGHLSLDEALERLVAHLTGSCAEVTTTVIVIVDNWDPKAYGKWADSIRNFSRRVHMEWYFLAPREIEMVRG
jgi:hypothetical protein